MSSSTSSPFAFGPSRLIPEEPSLDFQSLAKTLNFNLPLKLDKLNYVNWKAFKFFLSTTTLLAIVHCFTYNGMAVPFSLLLSNMCNLKLN
ncbi:hypothetical protein ACOSQ2_030914 [Xanthoceras sorbifolium]